MNDQINRDDDQTKNNTETNQEPPPTPPKPASEPPQHTLRKPLLAYGDEIKVLKFREPTGADIERFGNPVVFDMLSGDTPKIDFDGKKMTAIMSALANVPLSTIRAMDPRDWTTCAWLLVPFFLPDMGAN